VTAEPGTTDSRRRVIGDDRWIRAEFFFGAMSPYSWLAAERIGTLLPHAVWRPVFAGGLFAAAGRRSWGITDERAARIADVEARAAARGLGPVVWPDPWPTSDVRIARAMLVAEEEGRLHAFALAAMRLAFLEGLDLGAEGAVGAVCALAGLDAPATSAQIREPAVKDALRARTDAAVAAGVTGVPTVRTAAGLFWGDDRLEAARTSVER
jgi:2-hydroxychromene-2-carboxylate isomerase